jgi:hypothetical protein
MMDRLEDNEFTENNARKIMEKIHSKGWNAYVKDWEGTDYSEEFCDDKIRSNLADRLEVDTKYVMLPLADDPTDPKQVMAALEALAVKRDRKMPTIMLYGTLQPVTGFTLHRERVKVHTPTGHMCTYGGFYQALDTVVDANQ